jgi:hypothetical protein
MALGCKRDFVPQARVSLGSSREWNREVVLGGVGNDPIKGGSLPDAVGALRHGEGMDGKRI